MKTVRVKIVDRLRRIAEEIEKGATSSEIWSDYTIRSRAGDEMGDENFYIYYGKGEFDIIEALQFAEKEEDILREFGEYDNEES